MGSEAKYSHDLRNYRSMMCQGGGEVDVRDGKLYKCSDIRIPFIYAII